jgi:PKD domain
MKKIAPLAFVALSLAVSIAASSKPELKDGKAALTLRASPAMAFAPARITLTAQLKGGSPEAEDLYCPTVEWDWGDGTISQASADCEPFEPNKSEIQRSFSTQHVYKTGGEYVVKLLLKKSEKIVAEATASLNISRAINEPGDFIR